MEEQVIIGAIVFRLLRRKAKRRRNMVSKVRKTNALRRDLILKLGGKCEQCGETRIDILHVDHIFGRDWEVRRLCSRTRVNRYWEEYRNGVPMQVLCMVCNGEKNQYVLYAEREPGSDG